MKKQEKPVASRADRLAAWLCRNVNPAALRLLLTAGRTEDVWEAVRWEREHRT